MAVGKIRWSPRAISNLEGIYNHIAKDSAKYAAIFVRRIITIVRSIPEYPRAGRKVPEYDDDDLREKIFSNYRIVYRLKGDFVEIVSICHSAKPLQDIH